MRNMFNRLPRFVYLKKEKYFIKTDFRIFIDLELEMQGKDQKEACLNCLSRFYPAFLEIINKDLISEAVDKFIWFYKCGKTDSQIKQSDKEHKNVRIYDYNYDSDLIWGAFKSQYNVELDTIHLHWWKFKAMWNSLDSKSEFSKIRGYRAYDGKDEELLNLKRIYTLPKTEFEIDEQIRRQKIFEELNKINTSH